MKGAFLVFFGHKFKKPTRFLIGAIAVCGIWFVTLSTPFRTNFLGNVCKLDLNEKASEAALIEYSVVAVAAVLLGFLLVKFKKFTLFVVGCVAGYFLSEIIIGALTPLIAPKFMCKVEPWEEAQTRELTVASKVILNVILSSLTAILIVYLFPAAQKVLTAGTYTITIIKFLDYFLRVFKFNYFKIIFIEYTVIIFLTQ